MYKLCEALSSAPWTHGAVVNAQVELRAVQSSERSELPQPARLLQRTLDGSLQRGKTLKCARSSIRRCAVKVSGVPTPFCDCATYTWVGTSDTASAEDNWR